MHLGLIEAAYNSAMSVSGSNCQTLIVTCVNDELGGGVFCPALSHDTLKLYHLYLVSTDLFPHKTTPPYGL